LQLSRDIQILRFVGKGGVATLGQLLQKFWENARERTAYERLIELSRDGYLKSSQTQARGKVEQIFILTAKGAREFGWLERKGFMVGIPGLGEMKQQLYSQDTRLALEAGLIERGGKLVDWQNERELRRNQRLSQETNRKLKGFARVEVGGENIPDARALIEDSDGQRVEVDIEIDGSYYGQMLREKIKSFAASSKSVIWATTRPDRIRAEIEDAGARNITVFAL
jgi:hypothetical protein